MKINLIYLLIGKRAFFNKKHNPLSKKAFGFHISEFSRVSQSIESTNNAGNRLKRNTKFNLTIRIKN